MPKLCLLITLSLILALAAATSVTTASNEQLALSANATLGDLVQQQNAELTHINRRVIRKQYADLLANSMSGNGFPLLTTVQTLILSNFEMPLIEGIFHDALQELFYSQPLADICLKLWEEAIYNYNHTNAFEAMVRSQLMLYSLYTQYQQIDYKYLLQFGFILQRITQYHIYADSYDKLDQVLKLRLDNVINDLPSALKNFFIEPSFCLVNQMTEQMLYNSKEPVFSQGQDTYVLTAEYPSCQLNSSSVMQKSLLDYNNGNVEDLRVILTTSSPLQSIFIQLQGLTFLVASKNGNTEPNDNLWFLDLVAEESLVFKSGASGGYICLPDKVRNVVHVEKMDAKNNKLCQWKAIKCGNKC